MARPRKSKFKVTVLYSDRSSFEIRMSIDEDAANSFNNDDDLAKHIIQRSGFGNENFGLYSSNRYIEAVEGGRASLKLFRYAKPKNKRKVELI